MSDDPPDPQPVYAYPLDDVLRFQHLQTKSTHNSYHIEPDGNSLPDWAYTHEAIDIQLDSQGVRHFELDVRFDPDGDRFEVYHLPIIDEQTTCRLLTDCLAAGKAWSDAHRAHHPIVFQMELKDALGDDPEGYFAKLHAEIRSVWPTERVVTPELVQGDHASLGEAIASEGWPTLGELRGKAMFTLDDAGAIREAYTQGGAHLDGRLLFADADPGDPFAAIAVINDPLAGADAISQAVAANLLVRTRADSDGDEVATGDTTRRDQALAIGAHFITTDFPVEVDAHDYWVEIPGGTPSRCNPITAPDECSSLAIEDPDFVSGAVPPTER